MVEVRRGAPRAVGGRHALFFGRLHLYDASWADANDRHRDRPVLVVPDLGHAHLLADDRFGRHVFPLPLCFSTSTRADIQTLRRAIKPERSARLVGSAFHEWQLNTSLLVPTVKTGATYSTSSKPASAKASGSH